VSAVRRLLCGLAAGCGSLLIASTATALSCGPPEFSYDDGSYTTGDVIVIEGQGWTRGSDEDCDSSPFGDVRIYMENNDVGQILVASGAADPGGRFVAAVRVPAALSGRVRVDVVAMASAGEQVAGTTTSSPLTVQSGNSEGTDVQPVAFGPVDDDPAVWPWLLAMAAAGLAGGGVAWRIAGRRRSTTDIGSDQATSTLPVR
jgi:hypothetical protein